MWRAALLSLLALILISTGLGQEIEPPVEQPELEEEENEDLNLPNQVFSGEVDSFYIQEADVTLNEDGYLNAEMLINGENSHPDVVLSPGWALPKSGDLTRWIQETRPFQAFFTYSENLGTIAIPDNPSIDSDLRIHVTEFDDEACFGIMFSTEDCFEIENEFSSHFESQIAEKIGVEWNENEDVITAEFRGLDEEYVSLRYGEVRDDDNLITEASRSEDELSVERSSLDENLICGYAYGVELGCEEFELEPPQSSDFDCETGDFGENQYAFCSDEGEGSVKEIELGHTDAELEFMYNRLRGDYRTRTGLQSVFVNPESDQTLQFWENLENEYKGAEIEIIEWRGLTDDAVGGNQQEVVIEVDPAAEPDASIDFGRETYEMDEEVNLEFEAFEPGRYNLEVSGPDTDLSKSYEEPDTKDSISLNPTEEGRIEAELIAVGSWWNPLDSDYTVATASTEINKPFKEINHEFGEKFTISEGETTKIEGKKFYLAGLIGRDDIGYRGVSWRVSEEGDTNSNLRKLRRIDNMDNLYSESFDAYGTVCSINSETDAAEIIVKEERFNPWNACDRHPDELRSSNNYDMKDYNLGDTVKISPGEGLRFGESTAYLEDITEHNGAILTSGYVDWINQDQRGTWSHAAEGSSMTNQFYEGEMDTATCESGRDELKIVMEDSDTINSADAEWPEDWCDGEVDSSEEADIITADYGETIEVEEGDSIGFEDGYAKIGSIWFEQEGMNIHPDRDGDTTSTSLQPEVGGSNPLTWDEPKTAHVCDMRESSQTVIITVVDNDIDRNHACNGENGEDSDSERDTGEVKITLNGQEEFETGETVEVEATVTEQIAENSYNIEIEGPETHSEEFETVKVETSFTLSEPGQYTAKLTPTQGLLSQIGGLLTGNQEALAEISFQVINPDQTEWKRFCQEEEYETEQIQDQFNCIQNEIVPDYFEDSTGNSPEVAQNLCSDLLGYNYDEESNRCVV